MEMIRDNVSDERQRISRMMLLCSLHFDIDADYYSRSTRRFLRPGAIPSIFPSPGMNQPKVSKAIAAAQLALKLALQTRKNAVQL